MSMSSTNELRKRIILTADDYGATDFIDNGIRIAMKTGIIRTVSAMVNFDRAPESLLRLKEEFPDAAIGLHLNITAGRPLSPPESIPSLVDPRGRFWNLSGILRRIHSIRRSEVLVECSRQLALLESLGIKVDHLSSHHNLMQLYSPLFRILVHLGSSRGIPLRSTRPLSRFVSEYSDSATSLQARKEALALAARNTWAALRFVRYATSAEMERNRVKMSQRGLPHPDYLGDTFWGDPTPVNLRYILHIFRRG